MGPCTGADCAVLVDTHEVLLLLVLVMSTSVNVDEMLWYEVGRLGRFIYFTVAVQFHHILQPGTSSNVADNFVHNIQAVAVLVGLFWVHFGA